MIYQYYLEIKNRFSLLILTWLFTLVICYIYKEILLFLCISKINLFYNNVVFYFIFTDVKEVFSVYLKLIFFISKHILIFYFFFHILAFISLGLYKFEYSYLKRIYYNILFFFILLFFFINQFLLPFSWDFFLSFQILTNIYFEAKLHEYLNFYISFYYFIIFYCQFFIVIVFFFEYINTNLNLIKKFRKFFHYILILFSTIITPPDIISQILFSFIFIFIYELLMILNILKYFLKKL